MVNDTTMQPSQTSTSKSPDVAPTVSIVMPAFNAARYLSAAVQSICDQTFDSWELLAFDDGSSDSSLDILNEFGRRDSRVRVLDRPHRGYVPLLNEGIEIARGEFIARMDADDIAMPERLEQQVAFLRAHPDVSIVGTRVIEIDPFGCPLCVSGQELEHDAIDAELMKGTGWAMVHPTVMMRADHVRKVGGYSLHYEYSEDLDLYLRLAERGRVANIAEPLLKYRRHLSSVNFTKHEKQRRIKGSIMADAYGRRGLPVPAEWHFPHFNAEPVADVVRRWGWAAMKAGNLDAARSHAAKAVRTAPLSPASWKLMYCAVRGR